jgi:hypothetical protein
MEVLYVIMHRDNGAIWRSVFGAAVQVCFSWKEETNH